MGGVSNPDTVTHETESNDQNIRIITDQPTILKQPTPIIQYHPKGFRPYGQMQDVFNSHAPVKIVGGTYDAGKTFSCVAYIDHLARNYPGARLTFIRRYHNRIFHNIIPTYKKYLSFKPTRIDVPNPTPIAKYGGELPSFYEYWNGLDKPNNLLSDFFDAGDHHGIDSTAYLLLSQKENSTVGTGKHLFWAMGIRKEKWDPEKHIGGVPQKKS